MSRRSRQDGRRRGKSAQRREVWRQLAAELGGELAERGMGKSDQLRFPHGLFVFFLDTYTESTGQSSATYTRVRCHFLARGPLAFRIVRRNPFHRFARLFGMKEVKTGSAKIDGALFVRSGNPGLVKSMLLGGAVTQLLVQNPSLTVVVRRARRKVRKKIGEDGHLLLVRTGGKVKDLERLRSMVNVAVGVLEELLRTGVCREEPPLRDAW